MEGMRELIVGLILVSGLQAAEGVQVTVEEKLALSQAESRYWQAMYGLERATKELQGALAEVESRCAQAGGVWQPGRSITDAQCLPAENRLESPRGSSNGPESTDTGDGS